MYFWKLLFSALVLTGIIFWILILTAQTTTIIDELSNLPVPFTVLDTSSPTTTSTPTALSKGQKGEKGTSSSCHRICSNGPNSCQKGCSYKGYMCDKGEKGNKGDQGSKGEPQSSTGSKGEKGDTGGQKGEKGDSGPKGQEGSKGDAGGQKGDKGESGPKGQEGSKGDAGGQKGEVGSKGEKGDSGGQKGEKGSVDRMFNWGHINNEGTVNNTVWDGVNTVTDNTQTHHIFDLGIGTFTVNAIMMVDKNQPDQHLYIDEIYPANFNTSSISNPMDLSFVSVVGENKVTVSQGTGGDGDKKITFTSGTEDEVIKVTYQVTTTTPTCTFWYYRASSNNNKLHMYQVIIE